MTRFLGLGFSIEQVVTMCTANPAKAIGAEQRLGSLIIGRQADISVLKIVEGEWTVYDVLGASLPVREAVIPVLTVKRGEPFRPEWGPRSWGWEPDPGPVHVKSCC
ncbi:MAG: amidohydrolase family protein [Acidobacteriaceae bacterium]|nr:amidohydrolase family protein [Acidobacteriaceae bacterium]